RELGAVSRVQCHGAPTDLLAAYAATDVPESETVLFNPPFSRIAASAAALSGKPVVSAETFTCLYGFPKEHQAEERILDLKVTADSIVAHGINQILWHGMPFNAPGKNDHFYAAIHVGETGSLTPELAPFNEYLARVSGFMRRGKT